jgi:hypothetical protein
MKTIDYLGLKVDFIDHKVWTKQQIELTKNKELVGEEKWIYRVEEGEWKDAGLTLYEFTDFLYSHKSKESLLNAYKNVN